MSSSRPLDVYLAALDRHEGAHLNPPAYVRRIVPVLAPGGQAHEVITCEVAHKASKAHAPNSVYLGLITTGALKWGLPQAYHDVLARIAPGK